MSLRRKNVKPVKEDDFELGFGSKFTGGQSRIINEDGSFNILKRGIESNTIFEHLMGLSLFLFILELFAIYVAVNAIFAIVYCEIGPHVMQGINDGPLFEKFLQAFFFSVHTFTTVGYGNVYPTTLLSNIVVILDAFTGLLLVAIATGLLFLRFSKARVKIKFSDNMVIAPYKDGNSLQFRIVNASNTPLINVEASVTATWLEKTSENIFRRRFQRLELEMSHVYLLPLNWTIVHPIADDSPLSHKTQNEINREMMEFIIMINAFDPQYNQRIFKNYSYDCRTIIENAKFSLMYYSTDEKTILDVQMLNTFERL